jgi:hypothetical protein
LALRMMFLSRKTLFLRMASYAEGKPALYTMYVRHTPVEWCRIQQNESPIGALREKVPPAFRVKGREAVRWSARMKMIR